MTQGRLWRGVQTIAISCRGRIKCARIDSPGKSSVGGPFIGVRACSGGAYRRGCLWHLGERCPRCNRHIRPADLPRPTHFENDPEAPDFKRMAKVVAAPQGKMPDVPKGFSVQVFARALKQPRVIRIAPNGDIFVSESGSGRVLVFAADAAPECAGEARGLRREPGPALRHRLPSAERPPIRLCGSGQPHRSLSLQQRRPQGDRAGRSHHPEHPDQAALDARLGSPGTGSACSSRSARLPMSPPTCRTRPGRKFRPTKSRTGLAQPGETKRTGPWYALFDPEGKNVRNYATGLRNCSGMAMQPGTDTLWCTGNERDHIGAIWCPIS